MAHVSLYVPESVPKDFLANAGFLKMVPLTEPYALFGRTETCSCSSLHSLVLRGRSIIIKRNTHQALGYPVYALPPDCTLEETVVAVTWLCRNKFKTFKTRIVNGSLTRSLESNCWFSRTDFSDCCEMYTLLTDPVFMLKSIVVSPYGKGPTLESVLKNKVVHGS